MKLYELTYLISSELSDEATNSLQEKIASLISKEGGILAQNSAPLKKRLAYSIKKPALQAKETQAHLVVLNFQSAPENLSVIEKNLKLENKIIRYLILAKPRKKIMAEGEKISTQKPKKIVKHRVELKEIEKKLEEILGE